MSGGLLFKSFLLSVVVSSLSKRSCNLRNSLLEFVTVEVKLKLSMRLYVEVSAKCLLYSSVNHEVGTKAQPMFLSVLVSMMSLRVLMSCMHVVSG